MGSPYLVHSQVSRIHVVKTLRGFKSVLNIVAKSMNSGHVRYFNPDMDSSCPEWVVFRDILLAYRDAFLNSSRSVVFVEARYEWDGWENFQRVIVIDLCLGGEPLDDNIIYAFNLLREH